MNNIVPNEFLDSLCLTACYILIIANFNSLYSERKNIFKSFLPFGIFITLFSIYYRPLDGDFWFSLEEFNERGDLYKEHMEPIFVWLRDFINYDYILWRYIVWGTASFFICLIFKKIKIEPSLATAVFLAIALIPCFYYLRNSLGFSVLYYALSLYTMSHKKFKNIVILMALAFSSWFLHRSMPIYIVLSLVALWLPLKKQYLVTSLILFPILYAYLVLFAQEFLMLAALSDDTAENYVEATNELNVNLMGYIFMIIGYIPYVYIMYKFCASYSVQPKTSLLYVQKTFFYITFFLLYLSFLFHGQASMHLSLRFANTAMLPMAIFVASYFKVNRGSKVCSNFILLMLFAIICDLLVSLV